MIRRRELITLLGGTAAAWPLATRAQRAKVPTVGCLGSGTPSTQGAMFATLVQRLRQLGWTEDRTVTIEVRWAEGSSERAAEFAAEFVRLNVDVIARREPLQRSRQNRRRRPSRLSSQGRETR
jgi:putative ABC transport system substrate-binding protein